MFISIQHASFTLRRVWHSIQAPVALIFLVFPWTVTVGECNVTGHLTFSLGSFRFSAKSSMLAAFNGEIILLVSEYAGYNKPGGKMRRNSPDLKKRFTMILNGKEVRVSSEGGLCLPLLRKLEHCDTKPVGIRKTIFFLNRNPKALSRCSQPL